MVQEAGKLEIGALAGKEYGVGLQSNGLIYPHVNNVFL